MKTMILLQSTWLCFVFSMSATAQVNDPATYAAWLGGPDAATTNNMWDKVVAEKQEAFNKDKTDNTLRWNLVLAQYGLMGNTLRSHDEKRFDKYYETAEEHLKVLSKDEKLKGDAKALLSGLYGLKLNYSSMMGMVLGPKSSGLIEDAMKLDPQSPLVWRIQANSKMYTPAMFGGDMGEAIQAFEKSIELFEKHPEMLTNNWFYVDTHIFLGQAYSSEGQSSKAVAIYEKALKLEPNLLWVKSDLLPKAKQKALGK